MTIGDRRRNQRRQVLKLARIVTSHTVGFDCTVRNLSDNGALLEISASVEIPEEFDLFTDGAPAKRCRVVWRKAYQTGVEFAERAEGEGPKTPSAPPNSL
jgi:hypothetical protein